MRAPALTWIIDRLSAARAASARIRAGAEAAQLLAEHAEAQDFPAVPRGDDRLLSWSAVVVPEHGHHDYVMTGIIVA